MKSISLFDFPAYIFHCKPSLITKALDEVNSLRMDQNLVNKISRENNDHLNFSYYNKELIRWFTDCVNEVKEIVYIPDIELAVTECWSTRTDRFGKHHPHIHPNSIVSGILYLTDHPDAVTNFYQPNPWGWMDPILRIVNKKSKIQKVTISPEVGKLILFPSNILHDTNPNTAKSKRITISFNTFIKGSYGPKSAHLNINPVALTDIF